MGEKRPVVPPATALPHINSMVECVDDLSEAVTKLPGGHGSNKAKAIVIDTTAESARQIEGEREERTKQSRKKLPTAPVTSLRRILGINF